VKFWIRAVNQPSDAIDGPFPSVDDGLRYRNKSADDSLRKLIPDRGHRRDGRFPGAGKIPASNLGTDGSQEVPECAADRAGDRRDALQHRDFQSNHGDTAGKRKIAPLNRINDAAEGRLNSFEERTEEVHQATDCGLA